MTPGTYFLLEDSDVYQMIVGFINASIDEVTIDTIFFIREHGVWNDALYIVHGNTMLLLTIPADNQQTNEVEKLPFNKIFTDEYMKDLHVWNINTLSQQTEYVAFDAPHYYVICLIYNNGQPVGGIK